MTLPFHAMARAVACAALALPACAGFAQALPPADPPAADPNAAVPATRYDAPIGYRIDPAPQAAPDRIWVQSNATVAATNSMSLTMKGMRGAMPQPMHAMPGGSASTPPASTPPASTPPASTPPVTTPPAPAAAPNPPAGAAMPHDHAGMHDHGAMGHDMSGRMPNDMPNDAPNDTPMPAGHHHPMEGR